MSKKKSVSKSDNKTKVEQPIEDFIEENGFPPEGEVKPEPFLGAEAASLSIEAMKAGLGIEEPTVEIAVTKEPDDAEPIYHVAEAKEQCIGYGKHGFPAFGIPNYPKGSIILDNVDGRPTRIRVKDGQEISEIDYMTHMKDCEILNVDGKTLYKHPLLEEPIEIGDEGPMSQASFNKFVDGETTTPYKLVIRNEEMIGTTPAPPLVTTIPPEQQAEFAGKLKPGWVDLDEFNKGLLEQNKVVDVQVDALPETPVAQETMKTIKESIAEKRRMLPPPNALVVGGKPVGAAARTTKAVGTKPIVNAGGIVVHHPNNGVAGNRGRNIHNARPDKPIRNV